MLDLARGLERQRGGERALAGCGQHPGFIPQNFKRINSGHACDTKSVIPFLRRLRQKDCCEC